MKKRIPKFNTEEKNLIFIQALGAFATSLAGIFVTVFFYANSDLRTTVLYNLALFTSLLIFYLLSGLMMRRFSSALLIRLGIGVDAIFYLLLFLLKERSVAYAVPLGIFVGFGSGNFWAGYNLNQYAYTNKEKRVEYFASITTILNVIQALAPFIGGAIITATRSIPLLSYNAGYSVLFFVVFVLLGLTTLVVGRLPHHRVLNFKYSDLFKHSMGRNWKLVLWQQFVNGFYDVALGSVTGILIYLIVKGELVLGTVQTVTYFLGAVGSVLSIKLLNKNHKFYWIGSVGLAASIFLFAIFQDWTGVIIFTLISGVTAPFLNTWISTVIFKAMDEGEGVWQDKFHFLMERDTALGIPRILTFLFLYIFLQYGNQISLARTWLYILPIFPLMIGFLMHKMSFEKEK